MKLSCYIARTKDGFVATKDHQVTYLDKYHGSEAIGENYMTFIKNIDGVFMGKNTFLFIRREVLDKGIEWPYQNSKSYIITSDTSLECEHATILNTDLDNALDTIKKEGITNCWVMGGAKLIESVASKKLFDHYQVTELGNEILKEGIPFKDINCKLINKTVIDKELNVIDCIYSNK